MGRERELGCRKYPGTHTPLTEKDEGLDLDCSAMGADEGLIYTKKLLLFNRFQDGVLGSYQ